MFPFQPQDLKRANKLWNDNIHIRKVLVIPLEYCTVSETYLKMKQENAELASAEVLCSFFFSFTFSS